MSAAGLHISVVISTRNRPDALANCLAAIAAGERQPEEVVVVDQGSDAPAGPVVERYRAEGLSIRDLPQPPRGLGAAQNAGVQAATGDWIAVTDDDCLPDARWLAVIAERASTARWDGLTGRVLAAPPSGEKTLPVSTRPGTREREFVGRSAPWHVGSGNNFALRRDAYLGVGGCNERLGPGSPAQGGVDMDLFYRLLRAGMRIRYEPGALVLHERQTPEDRAARRPMYGYGMGACFGFWLREHDWYALPLLGRWFALRLARVSRPHGIGRAQMAREELAILGSTVRGLMHGLRTGRAPDPAGRL